MSSRGKSRMAREEYQLALADRVHNEFDQAIRSFQQGGQRLNERKESSGARRRFARLGFDAGSDRNPDLEDSIREIRRRGRRDAARDAQAVPLRLVNGVLRWELDELDVFPTLPGRRAARRGPEARAAEQEGEIVVYSKFGDLPPNEFSKLLSGVDDYLTPQATRGLRTVDVTAAGAVLKDQTAPPQRGKVLLLIHGTFSHSLNMVNGFSSPAGTRFLKDAANKYDAILAYGHPTLSESPMINALALSEEFNSSTAAVDVITHSRGGVVGRWWAELFDERRERTRRMVYVGSPLAGTSLASPARLKAAADLFVNYALGLLDLGLKGGRALAPMFEPLWAVSQTLMRIVKGLVSATIHLPILDAGVALVPGLNGQSAVGNNSELLALRRRSAGLQLRPTESFFVRSNFESEKVGWRFWRAFRDLKRRSAEFVVDRVFPSDNDLVVDTESMINLFENSRIPKRRLLDFGTSNQVHHLNYFEFEETHRNLRRWLL